MAEDKNPNPEKTPGEKTAAQIAREKLKTIALSFTRSAPDEHVVFGGGGMRFTLGDLRDLTGIRDAR